MKNKFSKCPRCQSQSFEILNTHSYCTECNFSPDDVRRDDVGIPMWAFDALIKSGSVPKDQAA